jgi:Mrp family chromosome partitioning ATPase/capsular polysaccharide biosynthesis protein
LQLNPAARSAFLPYGSESSTTSEAQLAASYGEVLRSRSFGEVVVNRLQLSASPEAVASSISTELVRNTNIMRLSLKSDNPAEAQDLAQRIAELFVADTVPAQGVPSGTTSRIAEMEATARGYPARMDALRQLRDRLDQSVTRGDLSRLAELNNLEARLAALESSYANLLVEINRARSGVNTASILDRATPAVRVEALPVARSLGFGLASGLGLGVALALLLGWLDDIVRHPDDVAAVVGAPPVAVVGRVGRRERDGPPATRILVRDGSRPAAEAFRILRANLRLTAAGSRCRTLVVTSPDHGEGKSFVACNLAIACAQACDRVLLVDVSLRKPAVQQAFGVDATQGFMEALTSVNGASWSDADGDREPLFRNRDADRAALRSAVAILDREVAGVVPSGIPNLSLLVAGPVPSDSSAMLGSEATARFVERLGKLWDIVIFDSGPILPFADTHLLIASADATLLVTRSGATSRAGLRSCLGILEQSGRPLLGVVLNQFSPGLLARRRHLGYYPGCR